IYLSLFLQVVPLPQKIQEEIVPFVSRSSAFPSGLSISFGAYLLFKLGWGVFTFNEVPQAHAELMRSK
ncbi:unnamed protein product, partial [Alternaria alternata]